MKVLTFCIAVCLMAVPAVRVSAQTHVGIILGGYDRSCEVQSKGRLYDCTDRRELFIGDVVTKKPTIKDLKVKWAPYAAGRETSGTTLEVVSTAPAKPAGGQYAGAVTQYMKDFLKPSGYATVVAASRDPLQAKTIPWRRATLLSSIPLRIDWGSEEVQNVAIVDPGNKVVSRISGQGKQAAEVSPAEAGMKAGVQYTILLDTPAYTRKLTVTLLEPALQEEILAGLGEVTRGVPAGIGQAMRKAAYLQLMSDAYPGQLDLYWLSYQILPESETGLSLDEADTVRALKARCFSRLSR